MKDHIFIRILTFSVVSILIGVVIIPAVYGNEQIKDNIVINENETEYYAVIAACSNYEHIKLNIPKIPFLPIAEWKLKCLYNSLILSDNWKESNIVLLINEQANRSNIFSALDSMSKIVDSNDVFLFSWQGHGSEVYENISYGPIDEEDKTDEVICPYDCYRDDEGVLQNYITDDELDACFNKINASGMCLIFECCLSGGLTNNTIFENIELFNTDFREDLKNPKIGISNINQENRTIIMSTHPGYMGKASFIMGFPLTNALSKAFKKETADKDKNGYISAEEAFTWAKPRALTQSLFFWVATWGATYIENVLKNQSYPAITSAVQLLISYVVLQAYCFIKSKHFIVNFPNIIDEYDGELLLVKI
jgi:hypothetical protein